eukprot:14224368-Alexandrium_andersonii.AAC.1
MRLRSSSNACHTTPTPSKSDSTTSCRAAWGGLWLVTRRSPISRGAALSLAPRPPRADPDRPRPPAPLPRLRWLALAAPSPSAA